MPTHWNGDGAGAAPLEPMALLHRLARRAMAAGADPSAPVSPDHELLMLCDDIAMLKRQSDEALEDYRSTPHGPEAREANNEHLRRQRRLRAPLVRLGKLPALTPAGIFAKAVAVRQVGIAATGLGRSLADDFLNCAELREAIWPAVQTETRP